MARDYDLIIIGGGCAGLTLASHLAHQGNDAPRTLVLDSRSTYHNDRTWCFWQLPGTAALDLVQYRWPRFRVAASHTDFTVNCSGQPYCAIPAERFYQHSLGLIHDAPRLSLLRQTPVLGRIRRAHHQWAVETPGATFTARNVVDTRPMRAPREGDALLWQSFLGAEVEAERACFTSQEATLMDFRHTPDQRMVFTYILPFSPTRALVEITEFSPLVVSPSALQPMLARALQEVAGSAPLRTLRTEAGVLPMGQAAPLGKSRATDAEYSSYAHAGVAGGGARACTGYAFQRIQRWAGLCAAHLLEHDLPLSHPQDPPVLALLDNLFLRVLRDHPHLAPRLFTQLFAGAPTPAVLRFLGDRPTPLDVLNVISALPPGPFLKAVVSFAGKPAAAWNESFVS